MFTNFKYPLVAFIAALIFTMIAAVLRYYGVVGAAFLLSAMLMAQAITIIWMIVLLIRKKR